MKASIFTLGCKVNETESASIMAALEQNGWEVTDRLCAADIYVLNTCAVTHEAERKSRQLVARARKYNPQAEIYVCGCASERDCRQFNGRGVTFVTGANRKEQVLEEICSRYGGVCSSLLPPKQTKTRAFIKIQDGCNNFCSYCIIPYLRGRERSRSIADVVAEAEACACPEIVLNGINISSYSDGGKGLAELVRALSGIKKRIRLGSLECSVIDAGFLSALGELNDFAPQFHLSLQSGSTAVLKAMNRHYTREQYLEKCKLIYSYFRNAAITTDIIAGFPTETEADFKESLSIIDEAGFARVHAFPFSPREGTVAYRMKDLPPEVKRERLSRLIAAAGQAESRYISSFSGKTLSFIAEEYSEGFTSGYTANYIKVYIPMQLETGVKYKIKLNGERGDGALGELAYDD